MGEAIAVPAPPDSPWSRRHLLTTLGILVLTATQAFEQIGVTAVMPQVAAALDGARWYAVAFAGPLATAAVAYAVAGGWIDRRGIRSTLVAGVVFVEVGLLLATFAPVMPVFVAGRTVQGFGGGLLSVSAYALVARTYDARVRVGAFRVLTLGWMIPSLLGSTLAVVLAATLGWRSMFWIVAILVVPATLVAVRAAPARGVGSPDPAGPGAERRRLRLGAACSAAGGLLLISLSGQDLATAWVRWPLLAAGLVTVVVAGPRLLPAGTWRAARGVPSVLQTRALLTAAYYGTAAYVPLLLVEARGLSPASAGWFMTIGAVTWSTTSWLSGRLPGWLGPVRRLQVAGPLMAAAVAAFVALTLLDAPLAVVGVAWGVAGAAPGLVYATAAVLALDLSPAAAAGRVSGALQLNDTLLQSLVVSVGGVVFAVAGGAGVTGIVLATGLSAVVAGLALGPGLRVGEGVTAPGRRSAG